jgi:hypothetical protein
MSEVGEVGEVSERAAGGWAAGTYHVLGRVRHTLWRARRAEEEEERDEMACLAVCLVRRAPLQVWRMARWRVV